jgi:hypothetical protein
MRLYSLGHNITFFLSLIFRKKKHLKIKLNFLKIRVSTFAITQFVFYEQLILYSLVVSHFGEYFNNGLL